MRDKVRLKENKRFNSLNSIKAIWLLCIAILSMGSASAAAGDINPGPLNYYTGCTYGCTANDVQGVSFTVVDDAGNPIECMNCNGETASAYIDVGFTSTATNRYNIFFLFGLDKNGDGIITLTNDPVTNEQYRVALADVIHSGTTYHAKFPISWPCDKPLYLVGPTGCGGPVFHWDNNLQGNFDLWTEYDCSPSSKCTCMAPFEVDAPCRAVAPSFSICQGTTVSDQLFAVNGAACVGGCTATFTYTIDSNVAGNYTYIVTCTSTAGCTSSATGIVTVNALPNANDETYTTLCDGTLTVATPGVLANDSAGTTAELVDGVDNGTLTLNADGSFTYAASATATSDKFTYKVIDANGCYAQATATITVKDCEAPTISCPPAITNACADMGQTYATITDIGQPTVNDPTAVITNNAPENDQYPIGTTTVTWTATDPAGNKATCDQLITVKDCEAPTISCPPAITNACADMGQTYATITDIGQPAVNDPTAVITNNAPENGQYPIGTTTVTWTATDPAGNKATCDQLITVKDCEAPTISCPPAITNACADMGQTYATITDIGQPAVNDPTAVITNNAPENGQYPIGTTTVTWTATDPAGNKATCDQLITVKDCEAPTISCPPAITNACADMGQTYATITDIGQPTVNDPTAVITNNAPENGQYPIGTTTVTWTATDPAGNKATCDQLITVKDCEAPTISCPPAITNACADMGQTYATITDIGQPTVNDPTAVITNNAPENDQYPIGTTTVTWTATDPAGNKATCDQLITVKDCEAPTISCPPAITNACADMGQTYATITDIGQPTVNDPTAVITNNAPENDQYPIGTTTVTWTATDPAGNKATCDQLITVKDCEAPTISCPPAITNACADMGQTYATITDIGQPTVNDPTAVITNNAPENGQYPIGTTTVTWTATDPAGNKATCDQLITVKDCEAPTISCPPAITNACADMGQTYATITDIGQPTVNDPTAVITNNAPENDQYPIGTTTVTWTATDPAGNKATCDQLITVKDCEAPTISCPPAITNACADMGQTYATITDIGQPTVNDPTAVITNNAPENGQYPIGTTTVTWTATDPAGNKATCDQLITVKDCEAPTISCPPAITNACADLGQTYATITDIGQPAVNDPTAVITNNAPENGQYPIGTTTVTWTATDPAGNKATCDQLITVKDCEAPTISCPPDIVDVCAATGTNTALIEDLGQPTVDDPTAVITNNAPAGDLYPIGTTTVTWTATDLAGNKATCEQSITVIDCEAPTISCPPDVADICPDEGQDYATIANIGQPTVNDPTAVITNNAPENDQYPIGTTTVTWTATDPAGNEATCDQSITVNEPPVCDITGPDMVCQHSTGNQASVEPVAGATYYWDITNGKITAGDGTPTITWDAYELGEAKITVKVTAPASEGGCESTCSLLVSVECANTCPVASDDEYGTPSNTLLVIGADKSILINDEDVDGDSLTAVLLTGPSHGTLTLNPDGSFSYKPATGFIGTDTFTYKAFDGECYSEPATVTILMAKCPWFIKNELYTAQCGVSKEVPASQGLLANDPGATAVVNPEGITIDPKYGTIVVEEDGSFVYNPPQTIQSGTYVQFKYSATNGVCEATYQGIAKIQVFCP